MSQGCGGFQAELEYRTDEWLAKVLRAAGLGHRVIRRRIHVDSDSTGILWLDRSTRKLVPHDMRLMLERNAYRLLRQLKKEREEETT
jgi:hypothetical protein